MTVLTKPKITIQKHRDRWAWRVSWPADDGTLRGLWHFEDSWFKARRAARKEARRLR